MMGKRPTQVRAPKPRRQAVPQLQRHLLRRGRCVVPAVKPDFHEAVFIAEEIGTGGIAVFIVALISLRRAPWGGIRCFPAVGNHEVDLPVDGIYLVFEKGAF